MEQTEEKKVCVYVHTNKINGKKYVGQTCTSLEKRSGQEGQGYLHKNKEGKYVQPLFAAAILKYGWDNFSHEVLAEGLSFDEANEMEQKIIKEFDTTNPEHGYNIREGGLNSPMSEESKIKLSESLTGKFEGEKNPMYGKRGELSPNWGKKDTPEQIQKKRERMLGEKNPMYGITKEDLTPEQRWNRGKGARGKERPKETREKLSNSLKKYYETHEHHLKGVPRSEEYKQMMSEKFKGRLISEETKKKMSENHYDCSGGKNPRAKKVRCIETGEVFDCAKDAGLKYNNTPSNPGCGIRDCCNHRSKTSGIGENGEPLHWEWID